MPDALTITPGFLRQAIRDSRYWQPHHPERQAYADWVTNAFRAVHAADRDAKASGPVQVRAYVRLPRGSTKPQRVRAHVRGRPHGAERVAYRPRDERGFPAVPGTRPEPQMGGGAPSLPASSTRPSPSNVDGLRAAARLEKNSSTRIFDRGGGTAQLRADFEALGPRNLQTRQNGTVTMGDLPDGSRAIMRTTSTDGRPTLEIQPLAGRADKFRY